MPRGKYSTGIQKVTYTEAAWFGKFTIVGSIPATCCENGRSKCFETEADALAAILADPWIQQTPDQTIQLADCSIYQRNS